MRNEVNTNFQNENLINAITQRRFEAASAALDAGADPNCRNEDGETALIIAASSDQLDIVNLLLERGADVDESNYNLFTALFIAAKRNNTAIIDALLQAGADIDLPMHPNAEDQSTALTFAIESRSTRAALRLLWLGANPHVISLGESTLKMAYNIRDTAIIHELLRRNVISEINDTNAELVQNIRALARAQPQSEEAREVINLLQNLSGFSETKSSMTSSQESPASIAAQALATNVLQESGKGFVEIK